MLANINFVNINIYFIIILAHIEHCNALDYAACAGVVVGCAAVCSAAEIDAPACIACLGGSYSTCKNCF